MKTTKTCTSLPDSSMRTIYERTDLEDHSIYTVLETKTISQAMSTALISL